jgi:uncharacterized Zn-binding protein involved in type VI secretion
METSKWLHASDAFTLGKLNTTVNGVKIAVQGKIAVCGYRIPVVSQ